MPSAKCQELYLQLIAQPTQEVYSLGIGRLPVWSLAPPDYLSKCLSSFPPDWWANVCEWENAKHFGERCYGKCHRLPFNCKHYFIIYHLPHRLLDTPRSSPLIKIKKNSKEYENFGHLLDPVLFKRGFYCPMGNTLQFEKYCFWLFSFRFYFHTRWKVKTARLVYFKHTICAVAYSNLQHC